MIRSILMSFTTFDLLGSLASLAWKSASLASWSEGGLILLSAVPGLALVALAVARHITAFPDDETLS